MRKESKTSDKKIDDPYKQPECGCRWVNHDGSHCGKPVARFTDMCDSHGIVTDAWEKK